MLVFGGISVSVPVQAAQVQLVATQSWWSKTKALFQKPAVKPAPPVAPKPTTAPVKPVVPKSVPKAVKPVAPTAKPVSTGKPVTTVKPVEKIEVPVEAPEPVTTINARPEQVTVHDIGAYRKVKPDVSNLSLHHPRLLPNGQVIFSKFVLVDSENTDFKSYVFENGSEKEYTTPGYIQTNNQKGNVVHVDELRRVYFESKGKKTRIPTLGGNSVSVTDINEAGQVVGSSSVPFKPGDDDGGSRAFLWHNGVMKNLGALDGSWSMATAINNKGQVVGSYTIGESDHKTFIYENGTMKRITAEGKDLYIATDIKDSGLILGKFNNLNPNCEQGYCLTDVTITNGKVEFLDSGVSFTAVNNSNEFVGVQFDPSAIDQVMQTFIGEKRNEAYTMAHVGCSGLIRGRAVVRIKNQLYYLDDIVKNSNIFFECAKNINDRGEILATGFTISDGHDHEYLITLPTQLPENIQPVAAKSTENVVPQIEPRDINKGRALPSPN